MTRILNVFAAGAVLASLAGCGIAARDPWEDPGTWRSNASNEVNLQSMVANPNDLTIGQSDRTSSGVIATTAVNRWLTDKVKALPAAQTFTVGGTGGASGGGQAVGPQ